MKIGVTSSTFAKHPVRRKELTDRYADVMFYEGTGQPTEEQLIALLADQACAQGMIWPTTGWRQRFKRGRIAQAVLPFCRHDPPAAASELERADDRIKLLSGNAQRLPNLRGHHV